MPNAIQVGLPILHDDPVEETVVMMLEDRRPARPLWLDWPVTYGFDTGAFVGPIADSLAAGGRWRVGSLVEARGPVVIWLLPVDTPYIKQVAAWLVESGQP